MGPSTSIKWDCLVSFGLFNGDDAGRSFESSLHEGEKEEVEWGVAQFRFWVLSSFGHLIHIYFVITLYFLLPKVGDLLCKLLQFPFGSVPLFLWGPSIRHFKNKKEKRNKVTGT